jgi:transposase InsO family protein
MRQDYPVPPMCRLLGVSVSGYYAWRKRTPSKRARQEARLETEVLAAHQRTRESFGPERLQKHLEQRGVCVGVHRIKRLRRKLGLIQHTDRGSQYCAQAYQKLLRQFGMRASMSRRGNCYDNAPIESFWGSLKNELIYHQRFATREQARLAIAEYIEMFYNRQRTQARLNYLSPAAFTRRFYLDRTAA